MATIDQKHTKILQNKFHPDLPLLLTSFNDGAFRLMSFFQRS